MDETILSYRVYIFLGLLALLLLIQYFKPFRKIKNIKKHAATNLSLQIINSIIVFLLVPGGLYLWAQNIETGVLHLVNWPYWIEFTLSLIVFDLLIYWQHRVLHEVPLLWRLHKVHHTDLEMETTTALRFHPLEIALSLGIKMIAIVLIGPPAIAVVVFEILLNANAMVHHSNFTLPKPVDAILNKLIITQTQHYVHHSEVVSETNSNYGFFLSVWDYIFRTRKTKDLKQVKFGLKEYQKELSLKQTLILPFENN